MPDASRSTAEAGRVPVATSSRPGPAASVGDARGMATVRGQPTDAAQRLALLDALRGFALAGVLLANLVALSLYAFLPGERMAALATAGIDRLLDPALGVLVSGKFIALFSLLFGVGFAIQMQRAAGDPAARRRYLRRLGALLAIGLLHGSLLWWGDVLRYYAVLGLVLLPLYRWPTRWLVIIGAVLIVVPQPLLAQLFAEAAPRLATQEQAYAAALAAFTSPDGSTMLHGNRAFFDWWLPMRWGIPLAVAGCMLIGVALGRSRVLHDPAMHAPFWRRLLIALPVGLALALGLMLAEYGRLPGPEGWPAGDGARAWLRMLNRTAALLLGLGYMAGFVWLFGQRHGRRALLPLAPVGRMALSNYLAQTVVGVGVFYGVGLGLGPRYGLVGVGVAWVLVFAVQIAVSHWWLARFRFGPAEWLWRSATYARWQPMRR
ncbi:MAG: DUF418 domain-containing protein [Lysobacter sp.]